ncbi:uncharacterized protein HMPREF1541_09967 [Cyphellophora europaea CBS 101466]|uniref:BRCT domain-containing protein n=1 Tax=Cyphellophora europaea (strain CBS 101466) TaxID=1220924 RepID=W2S8P0_CYPE1|nr:uncharacterized protein HMPREF1541_09967 [Cyphellophora europaea CBS 101466]ETN45091.1 hypothetical protein HMPREF1541_09967 [Cyphellophora europaea CBS 101466]
MADGPLERPLAGAVICCTSVAPELRTRYAEYVTQMGAEHKLDLTSDVTHLLVGDADTPKYKYVAKEREDVKVLKPEWVDAVRERWMEAKHIDLNALHAQYRMPTLAGLKICITGFDDLSFRAQLQKNVLENGGEYTGDLTKDVTHLIARSAEGKKYQYGTQWQKKIVSLKWYKDTLERGMQLDEAFYHPSTPQEEQGIGAWNRNAQASVQLGKRNRDEAQGPEPARKLRRTASARLNSQTDNMWSDLTKTHHDAQHNGRAMSDLKSSKSVPDLRQDGNHTDPQRDRTQTQQVFTGKYFFAHLFNYEQETIIKNVLLSHGGTILASIGILRNIEDVPATSKILLVPYQTPVEQLPKTEGDVPEFLVSSELWVEYCMCIKSFVSPPNYPMGTLVPKIKPPGFSKLVITSTGFSGIVPNHIAKIVRHLGATYEQTFTRNTSILICNKSNHDQRKLNTARSWGVAALNESWLWACIRDNRRASYEAHALSLPTAARVTGIPGVLSSKPRQDENKGLISADRKASSGGQPSKAASVVSGADVVSRRAAEHLTLDRPGTDFVVHADTEVIDEKCTSRGAQKQPPLIVEGEADGPRPLQSLPNNCSPKRPVEEEVVKPKKRLFQPFDGPASNTENGKECQSKIAQHDQNAIATRGVADAHALNGEIRELLDLKSRSKEKAAPDGGHGKKLMGRAPSNLSNASSTSQVRQSRASSVESMNTDGFGSEIIASAPVSSRLDDKTETGSLSFIGRAKSKLQESRFSPAADVAFAALDPSEEQWAEEGQDQTPALTQLVYEDPEEAIRLREKLAANRRLRSQLGQKECDPKPAVRRPAGPKRIKDDELLASTGWGAGRRTRQKDRSPQGLMNF